jgi:hypothetical protein
MSYLKRLDTIMTDGKFSIFCCDINGRRFVAGSPEEQAGVPLLVAKRLAAELAGEGYTMCATGALPSYLLPGQMCIRRR